MWRRSNHKVPEDDEQEENTLPKLTPGMFLEVLTNQNRLIFRGRVIDVNKSGDAIRIADVEEASLPYVEYNSCIKLRGFSGNEAICLVGMIGGSTKTFWKIDRLRTLQTSERRDYFRQIISVEAQILRVEDAQEDQAGENGDERERQRAEVTSTSSLRPESRTETIRTESTQTSANLTPGGTYAAAGRLLDISAGGCMMVSKGIFRVNERVSMKNVVIMPGQPPFDFTGIIRRAIQRENLWEYGCEFLEMDDQERDRLIQIILVLQRKELQARRSMD